MGLVAGDDGLSGRVIIAPMHWIFGGLANRGKSAKPMPFRILSVLSINSWNSLGIVNAPLVGHSMGGTVSLSVAINYPERVSKVVVVGSPIVGSSLALLLKLAGYRPHCIYAFQYDGGFSCCDEDVSHRSFVAIHALRT